MDNAQRRCCDLGGSTRKRKKISELKAFVETKLRSRSEKALEKIGQDETSRRSSISDDQVEENSNMSFIDLIQYIIDYIYM